MLQTILTIISIIVSSGAIAWVFNINSAVAVLKAEKDNLIVLLNTHMANITSRLDRIEDKLDDKE